MLRSAITAPRRTSGSVRGRPSSTVGERQEDLCTAGPPARMSPREPRAASPSQSVTTPPASSTSRPPAATSHGASASSKKPSNTPAAIHARSRQAAPGRRRSSNAPSARRERPQVRGASSSLRRKGNPVADHRARRARGRTRARGSGSPRGSRARSPERPRRARPLQVVAQERRADRRRRPAAVPHERHRDAHGPNPCTKFVVPSSGSTTQRRRCPPRRSPRRGRARRRPRRPRAADRSRARRPGRPRSRSHPGAPWSAARRRRRARRLAPPRRRARRRERRREASRDRRPAIGRGTLAAHPSSA